MANLNGSVQSNGLGYVKAEIDGISFNKIKTSAKSVLSANPVMPADNGNVVWKNGNTSLAEWMGVNAVDIDWNSAVLENGDLATGGSKTIYTTGDLLKLIDDMQQEIYTLAAAVIAIGTR